MSEPIKVVCTEEDLERFAGEEIPDPWADDNQPEWPNNPQEVE